MIIILVTLIAFVISQETQETCFEVEKGKTVTLDSSNNNGDIFGSISNFLDAFFFNSNKQDSNEPSTQSLDVNCIKLPRHENENRFIQVAGSINPMTTFNPLASPGFGVMTPHGQSVGSNLLSPLKLDISEKCNLLLVSEPIDNTDYENKECNDDNSCPISSNGICKCYKNEGEINLLKFNIDDKSSINKFYYYLTCPNGFINSISDFDYELNDKINNLENIQLSGSSITQTENGLEFSPSLMGGKSQTHILLHNGLNMNIQTQINTNNDDTLETMPSMILDSMMKSHRNYPHKMVKPDFRRKLNELDVVVTENNDGSTNIDVFETQTSNSDTTNILDGVLNFLLGVSSDTPENNDENQNKNPCPVKLEAMFGSLIQIKLIGEVNSKFLLQTTPITYSNEFIQINININVL